MRGPIVPWYLPAYLPNGGMRHERFHDFAAWDCCHCGLFVCDLDDRAFSQPLNAQASLEMGSSYTIRCAAAFPTLGRGSMDFVALQRGLQGRWGEGLSTGGGGGVL